MNFFHLFCYFFSFLNRQIPSIPNRVLRTVFRYTYWEKMARKHTIGQLNLSTWECASWDLRSETNTCEMSQLCLWLYFFSFFLLSTCNCNLFYHFFVGFFYPQILLFPCPPCLRCENLTMLYPLGAKYAKTFMCTKYKCTLNTYTHNINSSYHL